MNQLQLHKKIDELIEKGPRSVSREDVFDLISVNEDAREYFFYKADEKWLGWLWKNGFLDVIKQKAEDPTRYSYSTPELNYLVRVSKKVPDQVAEIISEVKISKDNFNPEVVDRFVQICSELPVEYLKKLVKKIEKEKWIPLMGIFNQWGFEYEKMFEKLNKAGEYESVIILAKAVLSVKSKEELADISRIGLSDNTFYFSDLSHTKVFKFLVGISEKYKEKAFVLLINVLKEVIGLWSEFEKEKDKVFRVNGDLALYDINLFELELSEQRTYSEDNITNLMAAIVTLARKLFSDQCKENKEILDIYHKYIGDFDNPRAPLPDSRPTWRLRLFVLSLCSKIFQKELQKSFDRVFQVMDETGEYYKVTGGAEYKKALQETFGELDENYQQDYIRRVFEYFGKDLEDKEEEEWQRDEGWKIVSSICKYLSNDDKKKCQEVFGKPCDINFKPTPSISKIKSGYIKPQQPITQEEFDSLSIDEIITKLSTDWAPEKLDKKNTPQDFHSPLNAEGVGILLKNGIANRFQEYIANAYKFFNPDKIDYHYTYSLLRGIQETIKNKRDVLASVKNWDGLIELLEKIVNHGRKGDKNFNREKRKKGRYDTWLADWNSVHIAVDDVLQELLSGKNGKVLIDFENYRGQLLNIINYLLNYPDPTPEDEVIDTAKMKVKDPNDPEPKITDPFTLAINSVRGRAFQVFVSFIYQDGKDLKNDVKELYKEVLNKENTRAIMFLFGHYLPSFYFRDKKYIYSLLSKLFPSEEEKKFLYFSAWEGFLTNNLYQEMFFDKDIQKLYERAIDLSEIKLPNQKHFKDPEEALAAHLALAYMFYKEVDLNHSLIKKFWNNCNIKRHSHFVSFIGRLFISGDNYQADEHLRKEKWARRRLIELWDYVLEKYKDKDVVKKFAFWISTDKDIFDAKELVQKIKQTLEITQGFLEWEYGLVKSIVRLAQESPEDTLEIVKLYLLQGCIEGKQQLWRLDEEWIKAFEILYQNSQLKPEIEKLINILIERGGRIFWPLEDVIR